MGLWGFGLLMSFSSSTSENALFWAKFLNTSAILIPVLFFYFALLLTNRELKHKQELVIYIVTSVIFFLLAIVFNKHFVKSVDPKMNFNFYPTNGLLYYFFPIQFGYLIIRTILILTKEFLKSIGLRKEQLKYVLIGSIIGFSGGSTTFPLVFDIEVYPFGVIQVPIYLSIITYAVIKYRLMDIRLAVTKAGIFLLVYTLVLGVPFGLAILGQEWLENIFSNNWFWVHTILLLLTATAGPFIYLHIQKRAEKQLLAEQHRYQATLRRAALGMNRIKDLKHLLNLMVYIVTRTVRIENAAVYLLDKDTDRFELKSSRGYSPHFETINAINANTPLIHHLQETQDPVLYEEVKQRITANQHEDLIDVEKILKQLNAELTIPCLVENRIVAFVIMGKKRSGKMYNEEDLVVFSILGSHSALAIENCQFLEAEKERLKREGVKARRESLDMMVSTMAHEIDNPLTSVITNVDILREEIEDMDKSSLPDYNLSLIQRAIKAVIDDSFRVSKIITAVREYSKGGDGDLKPMLVYGVLDSYRTLFTLIKKDFEGVDYIEEIDENLPPIYAEPVLIEETLVNFSKNAFQAVRHNENGKKVTLRIYKKDDDCIRIEVEDNGSGIPPKILKLLYEVPTTTKGSAEGTGIGLYRIRQICEILRAKYGAESEGEGKGALMYVEIPVYKGKFERS
jgi:signal transduction histidine kinase